MSVSAAVVVLALMSPATQPAVERVGGEAAELVEMKKDGDTYYKAGMSVIDTPLPVGYPAPTPPGAMELKHYPSVRAAIHGGETDRGAFFPLFRHIQQREIAMTAPVVMEGRMAGDADAEGGTMQFLYRSTDLGPTGEAEDDVRVIDTEAMTVLSVGFNGPDDRDQLGNLQAQLEAWIQEDGRYQVTGGPRLLGYNGPYVPIKMRWYELQLPVEPIESQE